MPGPVLLTCTVQPNVRMCCTVGGRPCHASYGVTPVRLLVGVLLRMYTAVLTASAQKSAGMAMLFSMHRAISTMVWLRRSTTPFCWGVYGAVVKCLTPWSMQNSANSPAVRPERAQFALPLRLGYGLDPFETVERFIL